MNELCKELLDLYLSVHKQCEITVTRGTITKWDQCKFEDVKPSRLFHDGYSANLIWRNGLRSTPIIMYFQRRDDGMNWIIYNHVGTNQILTFPCILDFYQRFLMAKLRYS